jgi:hypothetical protein
MTRGGKREGAGRKPGPGKKLIPGLKMRSIRMTDEEYQKVKEYIKQMRSVKNEL